MKAKAYIVHRAMCEPELEWRKPKDCLYAEPLYTSPPKREPLADEQIVQTIDASGIELDDDHVLSDQTIYYVDASTLKGLARAIEAAHGIGEKK
jgi:hypothetical protein